MSFFKRITATVAANVDGAIAALENHDAVVESSLIDMRRAAAKAQARLARVRNDGARLRRKASELAQAADRWRERARSYADIDEAKALECLRRKNECEKQLGGCRDTISQHQDLETRLGETIDKLEKRYRDLDQVRTMMRTRQTAAEALEASTALADRCHVTSVDDALERWEARIAEAEFGLGCDTHSDAFEQGFTRDEEKLALQIELQELKRS